MNFLKSLFEKKSEKPSDENTTENQKRIINYYLYGFVNTNPNYNYKDQNLGEKLFKTIIGNKAGIIIANSVYPYCSIDKDGCTIWDFAFLYLLQNDPNFKEKLNDGNKFLLELSSKFSDIVLWEDDTRLTFEENPIFGKAVPFIIPFTVFDIDRDTNFDKMILKELKENGHAHNYLEKINSILKEFMHQSVFTIGFDEFSRDNKNKIIDNFISAKKLLEK